MQPIQQNKDKVEEIKDKNEENKDKVEINKVEQKQKQQSNNKPQLITQLQNPPLLQPLILSPSKKQLPIKISQKCISGKILYQFCVNNKCQSNNNTFICHDQQCQCYKAHELCMKGSIKVVLKKIYQKLNQNTQQLKIELNQIFMNIINKISQYEENMMKQIDKAIQNKLIDEEKKFYQIFNQEKVENFNQFDSGKLSYLWEIIDQKNTMNHNELNKQNKQMSDYVQKIKKYQKLCLQGIQQINNIKQQTSDSKLSLSSLKSSILTNQAQFQYLTNFFPKKVKSLNLLFQASSQQFQIQKYYQKCGNQQQTVILLQTQKSKLIGGYTPLKFTSTNNQSGYIHDKTNSSFIFSLSNNDKFTLRKNEFAIYRYNNKKYINFGGGCLYICDKANENQNNATYFANNYYFNSKYNQSKQSYLSLNGNQTRNFKIKQWEVFKVEFE